MKAVLIFILLICLVLSLYGFVFNKGEALNFEELYKSCLSYITDIGEAFNTFRDGLVDMITGKLTVNDIMKIAGDISSDIIKGVSDSLSALATNLINGIGQFFTNLWTNIANFFGVCGHGGGECPDPCSCQCKDCI